MVDVLGLGAAVLAAVAVTSKYRPPVEGNVGLVRDAHKVSEAHNRWLVDADAGRMEHMARPGQQLSLCLEHEQQRSSGGHNAERLVRSIQDEGSRHAPRPTFD
jgi:hypothetical protein